ncbi:MAG: helix-turn-helix transcriptional regulator [Acidobacteriia bacterium]|nr:helix-turn-helix transcriptional regulator [Terriglobia bacterium]
MRTAGVRKAELARRLGCQKSQIDRLLDFKNSTRMEHIEAAFRALGKRIVTEVQTRPEFFANLHISREGSGGAFTVRRENFEAGRAS